MNEKDKIIIQNELNDLCYQCKYNIIIIDGMKGYSDEFFSKIFNDTLEYYINKEDFEKCDNLMKWKR